MENTVKRWTAKRKVEIITALLKGETTIVDVCRKNDLKQSEVEEWKVAFFRGAENQLKARPKDLEGIHQAEVKELRAKVGELVLEIDARKKLQALIDAKDKNY
jgi:transposase-like protein